MHVWHRIFFMSIGFLNICKDRKKSAFGFRNCTLGEIWEMIKGICWRQGELESFASGTATNMTGTVIVWFNSKSLIHHGPWQNTSPCKWCDKSNPHPSSLPIIWLILKQTKTNMSCVRQRTWKVMGPWFNSRKLISLQIFSFSRAKQVLLLPHPNYEATHCRIPFMIVSS